MDLRDSPTDAAFRQELRNWLQAHVPDDWKRQRRHPFGGHVEPGEEPILRQWQSELQQGGWAGISWPREYGGRGATVTQRLIFDEEMARAAAPPLLNFAAIEIFGPTLMMWGTPEQKQAHLPRILSGEEIWCQGYSEPDAGSDLASLRTRAAEDGDAFVVDGQKIWSSFAHLSDWCFALVRTDPASVKHAGLTLLIIDMRSPGITVRPIVNICGAHDFNEVFFEAVRVPKANAIGPLNDGWRVANSSLGFERSGLGFFFAAAYHRYFQELVDMGRRMAEQGVPSLGRGTVRQKLARVYAQLTMLRLNNARLATRIGRGETPGAEASTGRLFSSVISQEMMDLAMELQGPYSMLAGEGSIDDGYWQYAFLRTRANTIAGGTAEIQRNIIAERILGLPRGR